MTQAQSDTTSNKTSNNTNNTDHTDKTSAFEAGRARLTAVAYRILGSRAEAEDIVQDAWLKWHAADAGELRTPLAWLTTITTRLAIDRLRRLQIEQAAHESERLAKPGAEDGAPSAEDEVLRASSVAQGLFLVFETLSPDERAAFVLHEAFDCDYAQIADVLGKTPANCRQLMHRARLRLRRAPVVNRQAGAERRAQQQGALERLRMAIEACDPMAAMRLFEESATFALAQTTAPAAAAGAAAAASALVDATASLGGATRCAQTLAMPDEAYIAVLRECAIVGVVAVSFSGTGIGCVRLLTDPAMLVAVNRAFGQPAIDSLLARLRARGLSHACLA